MLNQSFIFLNGISHGKEKNIWNQGINNWNEYFDQNIKGISKKTKFLHEKQIRIAEKAINEYDEKFFYNYFPSKESWRLYNEFKDDTLYLDIETDGWTITVIGMYNGEEQKFLVRGKDLIGFSIIEDYERQYDSHPSFFHVLGHMGYLNQSDTDYFSPKIDNYNSKLWRKVGKSGIERVYEQELQGRHGKKSFQRNARGDRRVITDQEPFSEGNEIRISIDYSAQKLAYELMQNNKGSIAHHFDI